MAKAKIQTPVELLSNGILEKNWKLISKAYTAFTGLKAPKALKGVVEQFDSDDSGVKENPTEEEIENRPLPPNGSKIKVREKFDIDRFSIQHGEPETEDGKRFTKAVPFQKGMTNSFEKDPLKDAEKDDISYLAKAKPHAHRDAIDTNVYQLKCQKCDQQVEVEQWEYTKSTVGDYLFVCPACIKKSIRR